MILRLFCRTRSIQITTALLVGAGVVIGSMMTSAIGFAQSSAPTAGANNKPKKEQGERKKSLSFEDELVTGNNAKPELEYILTKKNFNFKRLIKLRENFIPEARRTSEDVKRGGN